MRGDGRLEDRLRGPVNDLIVQVGKLLGLKLTVHDEVTIADLRSRPDIAVDSPMGRVGYVELKAPGKGTPETWRPDKHDRDQWEKLKALPNLVYCDGSSWALYRKGVLVGRVGRVSGDLAKAGGRLKPADGALEQLFNNFLAWRPPTPKSLKAVVAEVAPLCRLLRDQVAETIAAENESPGRRPFSRLAREWRNILFPVTGSEEHDADFADSYAQAVVFALLLARVDGITFEGRSPAGIAEQLSKQHSLLGEALGILANPRWVGHLNIVDTILRIIGNIDWSQVRSEDANGHAELYETFLAEYDPELRQRSGTYYTPVLVARAMVRFVDDVLRTRLGKRRGFAAGDVITIDPAMGAGTFLAEVLDHAVRVLQEERRTTAQPAAHLRELFEKRLIGFELQAAPFAVTELRLHAALRNRYKVEIPREEPRFLTNALDSPDEIPIDFGQLYEVLKDSRERANKFKREVPVTVVIGNPPWRENAKGAAPWLEERRDPRKPVSTSTRPSMDEFRPAGKGRLAYNLSNMWTYFWRWSAWKAFEANEPAGVVALITPSAYVTSSAYSGMRRYLRMVADEGWIIDLSPERHRPSPDTRIFPTTQHAICIGIFVRSAHPNPEVPATVHCVEISGTRQEKIARLGELSLGSGKWRLCSSEWSAGFRPRQESWESLPLLGDLMPWQQPGVKSNRNWVWAPSRDLLRTRWKELISASFERKRVLFKETRDRKISLKYPAQAGVPSGVSELAKETGREPKIAAIGLHSFDRQYFIHDRRVIDFHRPELWQVSGPGQIYVSEQHADVVENGPGLMFSSLVPGMHYFDNRGGRVIPLYRSSASDEANVAPGLLLNISRFVGAEITPEQFIAYLAGVVAHSGYTGRFRDQLRTPGIRVPLTLDSQLWLRAAAAGREIIWLHTFGDRFVDGLSGRPEGPPGDCHATYKTPIPASEGEIPDRFRYDPTAEILYIGTGQVHPVSKEVWEYSVGRMAVVSKWLDHRRLRPRHRKVTSPLDNINPTRWTSEFDDELLVLLEIIRRCVELDAVQRGLLDEIMAGPLILVGDLEREGIFPVPVAARKPPKSEMDLFSER